MLLSALLILLPLGLLGLLASEGGSAWLLRQAAELARSQDIELAFRHSSGRLLRRLELEQLRIVAAGTRIAAERLVLDWRPGALVDGALQVKLLEVDGLRLVPPPAGADEPAPPRLPDLRLPLRVQIDRLQLRDAAVVQPDGVVKVDELALSAVLDQRVLRVAELKLLTPGARLDGELELQTAAPHALQGRLSARIDERLSGADIGPVEAIATLHGNALQPGFELMLQTPAVLQLRGSLELGQLPPVFDLSADWAVLSWPLQGAPDVSLSSGTLGLQGSPDDYRVSLQTRVQLPQMPPGDLTLGAHGNLHGLTLEPLSLLLGDGRLEAAGPVEWGDGVRWRLALSADRLDPGLLDPDWPGELGGRLQLEGGLGAGGADTLVLRAVIDDLGGSLRGYPVSARGRLDWRAGRLLAETLAFASGPNRVRLDGRVDERLDLRFELEAPELASLYPGLSGSLDGAGRLAGTREAPALLGRLEGSALAYEDLRAQALGLEVDWKGRGGRGRLEATGLVGAGAVVDRIVTEWAGGLEAHQLDLIIEGADGDLALRAAGGLNGQRWQGELQRLVLDAPALGEWRLASPSGLRLAAAEVRAAPMCLQQAGAQLCAQGGWDDAGGLDLVASLRGLDLAGLAEHLPGEAVIEGRLAADLAVSGRAASPDVTFDLRPTDGRVRLEDAQQPLDLAYRDVQIKGRFADDRGSAELRLGLGPNGRASGRLNIGAAQAGQRSLSGGLEAEFPDLALVTGFVPDLEEVQGRLKAALTLGGTLAAPRFTGLLAITDARARVPAAGVLLSGIELAVQGSGEDPLRVEGQIQSGEGRILLDGTLDLAAAGGPALDLGIRGKDFEAARLPEARVLVSPDLQLTGNGPYRLSGVLRIPHAAIEIKGLPPGTVAVSDDEIIVGGQPVEAQAPTGRAVHARVRVELGDAVTFRGFGLSTRLDGAVDAVLDDRSTLVDGKIELREGRYKAYGQDLTVERGRLLFAGPPGDPDLDLRALRVSRDGQVKAFLAMSGPLSRPRPRVYSEPTLPEAEALAYLLTGRGLDRAGQQEGMDIAGAAVSFGLSQGEPLLQDMSARLGLDELRVEDGASGLEDSSLVLGKYLNPDLYLGYSQGLFSPEGAVLLRLRLSEHLEVESRSGNEQSVDLFYKIEHD